MIRRASRDPGRDFTMNGNAIFSDLLYLLNLVIRNNIVIYVLQTSFCWKKIPKSPWLPFSPNKNGTSGTNEFLPKMSSNRCCVFIARIDLAKIMKLMLRVSSESKYSFFNRKVIEHIVEKMDVVVWSTEAELFLVRKSWRASLIFKTWDAIRIFAVDLLLPKLAFIS